MTPTDRQIEAVEDVLRGLVIITGDSTWDMEYVAKAALTAAAEVAEQERKDNCRHWRKTGSGSIGSDGSSYTEWRCPDCGASYDSRITAAAEVVEPKMSAWDDRFSGSAKEIEAHTIERCAQLCRKEAEACLGDIVPGDEIGKRDANARASALLTVEADILALKDKP